MKQRSHRGCVLYGIGFFVGMPLLLVVIGLLVIAGRERASRRMLNKRLDKIVAQQPRRTYIPKAGRTEFGYKFVAPPWWPALRLPHTKRPGFAMGI